MFTVCLSVVLSKWDVSDIFGEAGETGSCFECAPREQIYLEGTPLAL